MGSVGAAMFMYAVELAIGSMKRQHFLSVQFQYSYAFCCIDVVVLQSMGSRLTKSVHGCCAIIDPGHSPGGSLI